MLKIVIGNRAYSSWSMRGWLAVKQSGEEFEEIVVPMFDEAWEKTREGHEFAPGGGYSDIDMLFTADDRYVHKDGTPY